MALIRQFRRIIYAQVLLGIVAFGLADQNPGMLLILGAIGVAGWYLTEGPAQRPLPTWLTNIVGPITAAAWTGFDVLWRGTDVLIAMGYFMAWLQLLLLWGNKTNREYAQILVLSVLLVVAASALSVSILYALVLVAYTIVGLFAVLMFHFKNTGDQVQRANARAAPPGEHTGWPEPVAGRGYWRDFRFLAIAIGIVCAIVSVGAFVVTPRMEVAGHLLDNNDSATRHAQTEQAGYSDEMRIDSSPGQSGGSRQPVLKLRVTDSRGNPIDDTDQRHWLLRGAALDYYDASERMWRRSRGIRQMRVSARLRGGQAVLAEPAEPSNDHYEAEILMRRSAAGSLLVGYPPTWIASEQLKNVNVNTVEHSLSIGSNQSMPLSYRVRWPAEPTGATQDLYEDTLGEPEPWPDSEMMYPRSGRWRAARTFDPDRYARGWDSTRVRDFASNIIEEHNLSRDPDARFDSNDPRIVATLARHLRDNFEYTLDNPPVGEASDPIAAFLERYQRGHCELYAGALAAMARSLGLQARVVTGYLASEYSRVGGYFVVRSRHAHAWTEINLGPEHGWVPVDATPPQIVRQGHGVERNWWAGLREAYEHVEFLWLRGVVTFDARDQQRAVESMRDSVERLTDDDTSAAAQTLALLRELPELWRLDRINYTLAALMAVGIGLGLAYLARILIVRRRRLKALQLTALPGAKRRGLARRLRFYIAMLEMLERHGYVRPQWQSPYSFAQELAEANPMRFDPVVALTEIFYEIRFGHRQLDEPRRKRVNAHLKQLEHALANPEA